MYEHFKQPLLPPSEFFRRLARHFAIAFGVVVFSLGMGILGYHVLEGLPWIDSLVNSAMLLGGMGPVDQLHTVAGKLFASFYALYAGLIFLVVAGLLFIPILHRVLHRLHLDEGDDEDPDDQ